MSANHSFFVQEEDQIAAVQAGQIQLSRPVARDLPPVQSAADLLSNNAIQAPEELIQGVLHRSLKAIVAGPSKVGKTWLLLDMAVSVASGLPWMKWLTTKSKVLMVNFEIPESFMKERLKSMNFKKEGVDLDNLEIWTLRGYGERFSSLLPRMIEQINREKYGLIILDPIYKGLGGADENKAGDIAQLCNELEKMCVETGAALAYAHHFSKGSKANTDALDRMSGSGVFARAWVCNRGGGPRVISCRHCAQERLPRVDFLGAAKWFPTGKERT